MSEFWKMIRLWIPIIGILYMTIDTKLFRYNLYCFVGWAWNIWQFVSSIIVLFLMYSSLR